MGLKVLGISTYVIQILSQNLIKRATMIAAISRAKTATPKASLKKQQQVLGNVSAVFLHSQWIFPQGLFL